MDEIKHTVYREVGEVELEIELEVSPEINFGERAITTGHPDRWTPGAAASADLTVVVKKISCDGVPANRVSIYAVGGSLELTAEEAEEITEKALRYATQDAEDWKVEAALAAAEDYE